jgi:hypothetical protein
MQLGLSLVTYAYAALNAAAVLGMVVSAFAQPKPSHELLERAAMRSSSWPAE